MDAYNAPVYQAAKDNFLRVQRGQIAKGIAKYPEPLNPASWTREELIEHAMQENVDQMHYLTALLAKEQEESGWKDRAEKAEAKVSEITKLLMEVSELLTWRFDESPGAEAQAKQDAVKLIYKWAIENGEGPARLSEGRQ